MYENQIVKHGFDTQVKSKDALNRIQKRVHQTIDLADDSLTNIEKQNQQILRVNQSIERMESTMTRTKKYLAYFSLNFCKDKVALSFLLLIVLIICGIVTIAILPEKIRKWKEE